MKDRFEILWKRIGAQSDPAVEFDLLNRSYTQPKRYYHNLSHIEACLNDFRNVSDLTNTPDIVEFAIWYHDVVYDVTRSDNEKKSADLAAEVCSRANLSTDFPQQVHDLILATKHDKPAASLNEKIIIDADLAILGKPADEYDRYEKAIRKEYAHVPDADFKKGRAAVLRSFLEKPAIYSLDFFRDKYQNQAIENIQKAIADLT